MRGLWSRVVEARQPGAGLTVIRRDTGQEVIPWYDWFSGFVIRNEYEEVNNGFVDPVIVEYVLYKV